MSVRGFVFESIENIAGKRRKCWQKELPHFRGERSKVPSVIIPNPKIGMADNGIKVVV